MERDSFVFYKSFHKALKGLPPDEYKQTLFAVCEYALNGTEPELDGVPFMAFELIRPQIDANNKRYTDGKKGAEFGKLGGRPKKKPSGDNEKNPYGVIDENPIGDKTETPNVNENVNVNVNDNVSSNKDLSTNKNPNTNTECSIGAKAKRFYPPTVEQVREYAQEKGLYIDAERFVDFYESKGWVVGRSKMKDWKAAVRNWSRDKKPAKQGKLVNYDQREIDYDAILGGI